MSLVPQISDYFDHIVSKWLDLDETDAPLRDCLESSCYLYGYIDVYAHQDLQDKYAESIANRSLTYLQFPQGQWETGPMYRAKRSGPTVEQFEITS